MTRTLCPTAISHLDLSSVDTLAELVTELKVGEVELLAHVRVPIRDLLERSGVAQVIREERIFSSIVEGFQSVGAR